MKKEDYFIPNLFIPGVAKCGTSTLHELLSQHNSISMSTVKEPHFWTSKDFNHYKIEDIVNYTNLFNQNKAIYFGESSTASLFYPDIFISRLKNANNNHKTIKFIIIFRNPIDRAYSHYWWCKGSGREKLEFKKAFLKDLKEPISYYNEWPKHYYQFGLFSKWIKPFINEFGIDNIKFITLESLNQNPTKIVNECFDFLELPKIPNITNKTNNKTVLLKYPWLYNLSRKISRGDYNFTKIAKYFFSTNTINNIRQLLDEKLFNTLATNKTYPKLKPSEREWLKSFYKDDVEELKSLTGLFFNEWKDFS